MNKILHAIMAQSLYTLTFLFKVVIEVRKSKVSVQRKMKSAEA